MNTNIKHKDRLFIFLFGNESFKQWTLNLYNAINCSDYDDPEAIKFNTLDDFLYMGMKNDVSFIINGQIHLFEHQSTFNPNMPLRQFLYLAHIYEGHVHDDNNSLFSSDLVELPTPKLYVFYNGSEQEDEEKTLLLSDSFKSEGDVEVRVKMVNINYGHNEELLNKCKQLGEYSWFIAEIRYNQNVQFMNLSDAIDSAIMKMPDDFSIKTVILKHQVEVKGMLFSEAETEFEMNKLKNHYARVYAEKGLKEGLEKGLKEGLEKGMEKGMEEGLEKGLEKGRKEEHERIKSLLLEKGADKEIIDLIDNDYLKNNNPDE